MAGCLIRVIFQNQHQKRQNKPTTKPQTNNNGTK